MRRWLIEKLGGFPTIESALAHIKETDDPAKYDVLRLAVKDLFQAISPDDVLRFDQDQWTFMGKPLTKDQMESLSEQARDFQKSKLWSVLRWDVRYQLSKKMYEEGRLKDDFVWGQLGTYLFDVIKTRLKQLESFKT